MDTYEYRFFYKIATKFVLPNLLDVIHCNGVLISILNEVRAYTANPVNKG